MPEFPHIEVERVSVDDHPEQARARGIKRYPALAHGDDLLAVLFMTRRRIRAFLGRI